MPNPTSPKDALIEAEIERALRPYLAIAPPALLQVMREELEHALREHPVASGLVDHLAARPAPQSSGDVPVEGANDGAEAAGSKDRR